MIVFQIIISAYRFHEEYNSFDVEIIFRWNQDILYPHQIKELRIVLAYLWPNRYYLVNKEETALAPNRVTLDKSTSGNSTYSNISFTPPSPLPSEHEVPNHNVIGSLDPSPIPSEQTGLSTSQGVFRPIRADLSVDEILAQIRSSTDLDKQAFEEGPFTFRHLQALDRIENPQYYPELSNAVDDDHKQRQTEKIEPQEEEEEEEEEHHPLPLPDPSGTHSRIPQSEPSLDKQSSNSTRS